ncbi:MAG: hypothetical protein JRD05_13295, partial [Deltaproteobacteria bacterium]|nr:hypothetical protein [Deltaproteobacteria bacterium]
KSNWAKTNSAKTNWTARVLKTIARDGTGVKELADTFLSHFDFMKKNGLLDQKRTEIEKFYFKSLLKDLTLNKILSFMETSEDYMKVLKNIQSHEMDPMSAAELVVNNICVFKNNV